MLEASDFMICLVGAGDGNRLLGTVRGLVGQGRAGWVFQRVLWQSWPCLDGRWPGWLPRWLLGGAGRVGWAGSFGARDDRDDVRIRRIILAISYLFIKVRPGSGSDGGFLRGKKNPVFHLLKRGVWRKEGGGMAG